MSPLYVRAMGFSNLFVLSLLTTACGGNNEEDQTVMPSPGDGNLLYRIVSVLTLASPNETTAGSVENWCDTTQFKDGNIYKSVRTDDNLEFCTETVEYAGTYSSAGENEYTIAYDEVDADFYLSVGPIENQRMAAQLDDSDGNTQPWVIYTDINEADAVLASRNEMSLDNFRLTCEEGDTVEIVRGDNTFQVNFPCS